MTKAVLGIIGGSGIYDLPGLEKVRQRRIKSPWGEPSAALRVGEIAAVSPFRYTSLLMAIFLGLVIFGDWPDLWTWVGSALVVGAGIYTIWREAQLGRRR